MNDELERLRPEVICALDALYNHRFNNEGFDAARKAIRAELLRLAREIADLRDAIVGLGAMRKDAEAELAALNARIADAPICEFTQPHDDEVDEDGYGYYAVPLSIVGKTARLLVVEE